MFAINLFQKELILKLYFFNDNPLLVGFTDFRDEGLKIMDFHDETIDSLLRPFDSWNPNCVLRAI